MDLPVWYPEKVAQALRDWTFPLSTRQAHLSTLSVSFGTPSCRSPVGLPSTRRRRSLGSPSTRRRRSLGSSGFVTLVLKLRVLLRWMQAVCWYTPHWSEAFGNTMRWSWVPASVFSPSIDNKVCWFLRFIVFVLNLADQRFRL